MTITPRVTRYRECAREGCMVWYESPHLGSQPAKFCSELCWQLDKNRQAAERQRTPLRSARQKAPRKPVAAASASQRRKRAGMASIVSGATEGLDAAHLYPRDLGGCSDELCTVSLTRAEHRAFDAGELDLLPYLIAAGCIDEMCHALAHARGDVIALTERLTGCRVRLEERMAA